MDDSRDDRVDPLQTLRDRLTDAGVDDDVVAQFDGMLAALEERRRSAPSPLPPEERLAALDRLHRLHVEDACVGVHAARPFDAAIALGWWANVHRQARAIATLYREDLGFEAAPIARSVIEHAVTLLYLARRSEDCWRLLFARADRDLTRTLTSAQGGSLESPELEALQASLAPASLSTGSDANWPGGFEQICHALGLAKEIYPSYRMYSGFTHPGVLSTTPFVAFGDAEIRVTKSPPTTLADDALTWGLECTVWVDLALDAFLVGGLPYRDEVLDIARAHRVTVHIVDCGQERPDKSNG